MPGVRRQAEALAGRLSSVPLEVIYTSDLSRASETAGMIAARQPGEVPVVAMPELRELRLRSVGGADPARKWPGGLQRTGGSGTKGGGSEARPGERMPSLWPGARAGPSMRPCGKEKRCSSPPTGSRSGRSSVMPWDSNRHSGISFAVMNCSLSALECRPEYRPRLILLNDTCHLDGMEI